MMEESSDESAEIISNEEAEQAKKMQEYSESSQSLTGTTQSATASLGGTEGGVSPPAPLPAFISSPDVTPQKMSITPTGQSLQSSSEKDHALTGVTTATSISQSPSVTTPTTSPKVLAPGPVQTPYEVSSQIPVPQEMVPESPQSPSGQGGLFSWFGGNKLVSKVMEKTKSSMETMITTLDPGMKEVIRTGGDINVIVTSVKESKVSAVREAFQSVFGKAVISGVESQANTAAQPVGYTCGFKGAEERIQNLRQKGDLPDGQTIVSLEGFIVEMLPDRWYEMCCMILQDPEHRIELQTFSQPTPIPAEYILKAQDKTPSDYPLRWSGLAATIGQVVEESLPHIGRSDWHIALTGVSRRESLTQAAKSLAYMYKERLPTSFIS